MLAGETADGAEIFNYLLVIAYLGNSSQGGSQQEAIDGGNVGGEGGVERERERKTEREHEREGESERMVEIMREQERE